MNVESASHANSRLIYRPRQQDRTTSTLYGIATFIAWAFYVYLWMPLTTLALWFMGVRFAYLEVYMLNEPLEPPAMLRELPLIALCVAVVLIGWAEYNRTRFQGKERRLPQEDAGLDEIASSMHASVALGAALLAAKTAVLEMDPTGKPLEIQVNHSLASTQAAVALPARPAEALA